MLRERYKDFRKKPACGAADSVFNILEKLFIMRNANYRRRIQLLSIGINRLPSGGASRKTVPVVPKCPFFGRDQIQVRFRVEIRCSLPPGCWTSIAAVGWIFGSIQGLPSPLCWSCELVDL